MIKGEAETALSDATPADTIAATATIWLWSGGGSASWHFVTITGPAAEAIHGEALMRRLESGRRRGFGSVKVRAHLGDTIWDTSIFPHKDSGGWLLPIKAAVRKAERLAVGDEITVHLTLL